MLALILNNWKCKLPLLDVSVLQEFKIHHYNYLKKVMRKKVLRNKNNAELKNANLVQNSHFFLSPFLNHSHHTHSLIPHFSGTFNHSQSFIPHFLSSRLHFFQIIFLRFKEITHTFCKATLSYGSKLEI